MVNDQEENLDEVRDGEIDVIDVDQKSDKDKGEDKEHERSQDQI